MGITNLNKILLQKCNDNLDACIMKSHLSTFKGKTVAIDTSIYLYKYMGQRRLIESFYLMISIFKHYNIHPIFVFDGKPPPEKKELLNKRKMDKKEAESKYNELQNDLQLATSNENKNEISAEMEKLSKQFIKIKYEHIVQVKTLMNHFGVDYYDAEGEADLACTEMVINDVAYACMSDDMDLLLYGCKRVFRFMSLMNHTVICYELDNILDTIGMKMQDFKKVIILAGTDYNIKQRVNLNQCFQLYQKYSEQEECDEFFGWVKMNTNQCCDDLNDVYNLFSTFGINNFEKITRNFENRRSLYMYLGNYGFIFL